MIKLGEYGGGERDISMTSVYILIYDLTFLAD